MRSFLGVLLFPNTLPILVLLMRLVPISFDGPFPPIPLNLAALKAFLYRSAFPTYEVAVYYRLSINASLLSLRFL